MAKKSKPSTAGPSRSSSKVSDPRFTNFETDPRFSLPSKRQTKTKLDKRFGGVLKDEEFTKTAKVDRYGRKLSGDAKKKALQSLYEAEDDEDDDDSEDDDEDDDDDDEDEADGGGVEIDDDAVKRELRAADKKYDPARGGGFESSDSDSDEDEEEEEEVDVGTSIDKFQDEQADVPTGEITNRIAIVNIDWDHIKSTDLFAVFSSFVPKGGRIEKVTVYPSEFGKERMSQEEVEGPPKDIFKKRSGEDDDEDKDEDDSEDDEAIQKELLQEGDDQDFDKDALRTYQLERLRYYYAIMVCDTKDTAKTIFDEVDGREFLASSNFLDLRFVPDDTTFDDEPRDECHKVPANYKPIEFVTDALQHSNVKLTWDMHPDEVARKDSIKRAFGGKREDIAENDLRAYLASDSEDDEEEVVADGGEEEPKLSKKELARRKMREALGLKDDDGEKDKEKPSGPVGDMQITFAPALSSRSAKKDDEAEETTIEKYKRRERERKEQKRERARARREGRDLNAPAPEPDENESAGATTEDLGFNDPFFDEEPEEKPAKTKTAQRKEERLKKREAREAEEKKKEAELANLELLMADENDAAAAGGKKKNQMSHFDMNEILKEEKMKGKKLKGKAAKKQAAKDAAKGDKGLLQKDFEMDVDDARFKGVFEDHEFAIDPSNPKFKATEGMKQLLEKGRKKRKGGEVEVEGEERGSKKVKGSGELAGLVETVKRKAKKN